jgi:hypothetical protein
MNARLPRFRDSGPIRIGFGIIALVIAFFAGLGIASLLKYDFAVGPLALWAIFWLFLGCLFIVVEIGQTIIRRKT